MVRIAKVKLVGSRKTFEYLCPDTNIDEGDVVYLEDQESPSYVCEIVEVKDEKCKATKNVLSKAIRNDNVTLSSKYMDITKCDQECIVNSLNPSTSKFDIICKAILYKSNELADILNNNPYCNTFDMFVTDAGDLPSKHIIHIVMPFKKDDNNNEKLRRVFSLVIDKAIELKYKSIAIPYIGMGVYGYTYNDINQTLNDVMFTYQYKKDIEIDITSVRFNLKKLKIKKIKEPINPTTRSVSVCGVIKKEVPHKKEAPYVIKKNIFDLDFNAGMENIERIERAIMDNYHKCEEINIESLYTPVDFIKAAVKRIGGYSKVPLLNDVLNSDARKNIAKFTKNIRKEEIYCSSYLLKLNFTQIIQFMRISGYTFSPVSKNNIDLEVFKYIVNNNGFTKPQSDIDDYFYNLGEEISSIVIDYEPPKKRKKDIVDI